jgi:hypothetical protein
MVFLTSSRANRAGNPGPAEESSGKSVGVQYAAHLCGRKTEPTPISRWVASVQGVDEEHKKGILIVKNP